MELSPYTIVLFIVVLYFGWGKRKQFLKDWEKYERGESGIPKLFNLSKTGPEYGLLVSLV